MLKALLNFPSDAEVIKSLVVDEADLQLMDPSAEIPFNEAQWRKKLSPEMGSLSFLVVLKDSVVGHFAFLRVEKGSREAILGLVYLHPDCRRQGLSRQLVRLAECKALDLLDAQTMYLNVRSFNTPAHRLYLSLGYTEWARSGDLIRMKRALAIPEGPLSLSFEKRVAIEANIIKGN